MNLFNELNEVLEGEEVFAPKASFKKLVQGEYNFKVVEAKFNQGDERSEVVLVGEVTDEGEYEGVRHWFNLTIKGAPLEWINKANAKYIKQIALVNDKKCNEIDDLLDSTFGARLEERKGYLNLRRIFKSVSDPGPKDFPQRGAGSAKAAPAATTMATKVDSSDPFSSF